MICQKCGKEIQDGMEYCPSCGVKVSSGDSDVSNGDSEISSSNVEIDKDGSDSGSDVKLGQKIYSIIAMAIVVIIIVVHFAGQNGAVKTVKNANFDAYSSKTIGQTFDDSFSNTKWRSYKKNGNTYVKFTGKYKQSKKTKKIKIVFKVDDDKYNIESAEINGKDATLLDVLYLTNLWYDD